MSQRKLSAALGAASILTAAGVAFGAAGDLTPVQPVSGNLEVIGTGLSGGSAQVVVYVEDSSADDQPLAGAFEVDFYTDADLVTPLATITVSAANVDDPLGNDDDNIDDEDYVTLDLGNEVAYTSVLANNPEVTVIDIRYIDPDGTDDSFAVNADAITTSATDERFNINRTRPSISTVFRDGDNDDLLLQFQTGSVPGGQVPLVFPANDPDGGGGNPAAANPNQVDPAGLSEASFELDTGGGFSNIAAADFDSFVINAAPQDTYIVVNYTPATSSLDTATGSFRYDSAATGGQRVFDASGNLAAQTTGGNPITALPTFEVASVEWADTFNAANNQTNVLRVTYTLPLDSTDVGDAAFYNNGGADDNLFLGDSSTAADTNLIIDTGNAPVVDPDDAFSALVSIDAAGAAAGALIGTDGLADSSNGVAPAGRYFLSLFDGAGNEPASLYGNAFDADQTGLTIGDGIEPTLATETSAGAGFLDVDGDGTADAVVLGFTEPIAAPGSSGFTVAVNPGATVQPFGQIDPETGELVDDTTAGTAAVTISSVERISFDIDRDGTIEPREQNAGLRLNFDPSTVDADNDGNVGAADTDGEATLGTGFTGATAPFTFDYTVADESISDANGNVFTNSDTDVDFDVDVDFAAPVLWNAWYFAGDNQQPGSNDQYIAEQDDAFGDQADNDRLALIFGEDLGGGTPAAGVNRDLSNISLDGTAFEDDTTVDSVTDNVFTIENESVGSDVANEDLGVGTAVSFSTPNPIEDAATNPGVGSGMVMDARASYILLNADGDWQATLVDTSSPADGNADQIFLTFSEPVEFDDIQTDGSQFTVADVAGATVTEAGTSGSTDAASVILTLGGSAVAMTNTPTINFLGTVADSLSSAATGFAVVDVDGNGTAVPPNQGNDFIAQQISDPTTDTEDVAIQHFSGTILDTDGGSPVPVGTSIEAYVAVPVIRSITATHNNIPFTYEINDQVYGGAWEDSLEAFMNRFYGLRSNIYLHRYENNAQEFTNAKDDAESLSDGEDLAWAQQVISVTANFDRLSFQGVGETRDNSLSNGSMTLYWDFLRSTGGSLSNLFSSGYNYSGSPLSSVAVIDNADGQFEIAVSAPTSAFTGNSRLATIAKPIIFVVSKPDGTNFAVSSLLTSATASGDPIEFSPEQLEQTNDGAATGPTGVTFDLSRVGQVSSRPGWNLVPFPRAGGFATASNRIPGGTSNLPAGVSESNLEIGTQLGAASPLEQFVYWADSDNDGVWDESVGSIRIDLDAYRHFRFTMTAGGVQVGSSIDNFIGGYALGFYNGSGGNVGFNQFGTALAQPAGVFATNPIAGGNANATQGWVLATVVGDFDPATNLFTPNTGLDYAMFFRNSATGFLAPWMDNRDGTPEDFGVTDIEGPEGAFLHYAN